jgi:hypothetical protein
MKKLLSVLFLVLLSLPGMLLAHGGVSNQSGDVIVFLTQQPLSPLLNEDVRMTFAVKTLDLVVMPGVNVNLRLIETNSDSAQDKTIASETKTADVNGNFDFTYKFTKEGYYDIELVVPDPVTGEPAVMGFLVQPRQAVLPWLRIVIAILVIFGVTTTYTFIKTKKPIQ